MKIRQIKIQDIKKAAEIVGLNYSKHYEKRSDKEIQEAFKKSPIQPEYLVAEDKGKIIGFAGYMQSWMDYNIYLIFWVNVAPTYQRNGVGTVLMKRVINAIRRKKASTILLTTSKPKFYSKKFGFKTLSKFKDNRYHLMGLAIK